MAGGREKRGERGKDIWSWEGRVSKCRGRKKKLSFVVVECRSGCVVCMSWWQWREQGVQEESELLITRAGADVAEY